MKHGADLVHIEPLDTSAVNLFNGTASVQYYTPNRSLLRQFDSKYNPGTIMVTAAMFASKLVPVVNNKVPLEYQEKWVDFLNMYANSGLWDGGSVGIGIHYLDPSPGKHTLQSYMLEMDAIFGGRPWVNFTQAVIYAYIHSSEDFYKILYVNPTTMININDILNKFVGWDVFVNEGETGNDDWSNCPFKCLNNPVPKVIQPRIVLGPIATPSKKVTIVDIDKLVPPVKNNDNGYSFWCSKCNISHSGEC